jgi:hypothetical protein
MAKQKITDFLGNIEKAIEARDTARESLEAVRGSTRTLPEKINVADIRWDALVESGEKHLEYWGRATAGPEVPWSGIFGENNCHAEAVFAAMNPELLDRIHEAIEAEHQRHLAAGVLVISAAELPAEVAKAEAELFDTECALEAAYCAAEDAGFLIDRDPDLSPEAVLGIERGESLEHDFFSEKMERILAARDGAHAVFVAAREAWQGSLGLESRARTDEELEAAKKRTEHLAATKTAREVELQRKIKLAGALEDYVRDHRKAAPLRPKGEPGPDDRKPVSGLKRGDQTTDNGAWRDRFDGAVANRDAGADK